MIKKQGLYTSFLDYITEKDDLVSVGKKAAFEERIKSIHEEGIGELDTIEERKRALFGSRNNAPTGNYFEYDIKEIEFCCDKMRSKQGTTDLLLILDRVEGEGLNRLWHCRCPYCEAPLVLSRTRLRIENP